MEKLEEELKTLEADAKKNADEQWQLKVKESFLKKRIKLVKEEMEALKEKK